jgi:hypothetical protein
MHWQPAYLHILNQYSQGTRNRHLGFLSVLTGHAVIRCQHCAAVHCNSQARTLAGAQPVSQAQGQRAFDFCQS